MTQPKDSLPFAVFLVVSDNPSKQLLATLVKLGDGAEDRASYQLFEVVRRAVRLNNVVKEQNLFFGLDPSRIGSSN